MASNRVLWLRVASTLAVSLALVAPESLGLAGVVAACPGRAHDPTPPTYTWPPARYVVAAASASSLTGVSASIEEYDPAYTGWNGTGTNATIMINRATGTPKWAQLGWFKSEIDNGTIQRQAGFEFYLGVNNNHFTFWDPEPIGNSTWYEILQSGTTFNAFVASQLVWSGTAGWSPDTWEAFGETHDAADQMPGETNNHVLMDNVGYFTGSGPTFHLSTATWGTAFPLWYGATTTSSGHYQMWDKNC